MPTRKLQTQGRITEPVGTAPSAPASRTAAAPSVLLLTELFPPAVGGSPMLFGSIYSRMRDVKVAVLTDDGVRGPTAATVGSGFSRTSPLTVIRRPLATTHWGLLDRQGLSNHVRVAMQTRALGSRGRVIVHCGRALPEGVAAWLSHRLGGPAYVCWAHGEDIATAHLSREFTWMMKRVYLGAAVNIANSRNTGKMFEALGVAPDRIHVVYPGVDVERFHPGNDGSTLRAKFAGDAQVVLLSVGRLQRRKGHDLAIEAVSKLDRSLSVRYLIAGDGEERARLEELAAKFQVQDRVRFLGEVPARDLPQLYAACDIFMLPNRIDNGDVEGFGIVFLEAAATGRPSIGGATGGVPEAVADGQTGLLVGGTDAEELAAVIQRLASSETIRQMMGAAGRDRVCRDFTWERAAAEVGTVHVKAAALGYLGTGRR